MNLNHSFLISALLTFLLIVGMIILGVHLTVGHCRIFNSIPGLASSQVLMPQNVSHYLSHVPWMGVEKN